MTTAAPLAVHFSSATDDWHTPDHILERVLRVLGAIDLDPCSNLGEPNVPARHHYTTLTPGGGLPHPWKGRVWLNPPYGRSIGLWVARLVDAYHTGETTEAIALLPARTDTAWFRQLRPFVRCFLRGRLTFKGAKHPAPFPSVLVYLGHFRGGFIAAFEDIGDCYAAVA